ncbi:purple acid phosphatase family protein [Treponema sp. R80B11-R83G3]
MFFKKSKIFKKQSVLQLIALLLAAAFAIVVVACPGDDTGGKQGGEETIVETPKNYVSGDDGLNWGVSSNASVLTLGLQPGNDTTEIKLNWYSSGAEAGKVAQVRFVKGTFTNGTELIKEGDAKITEAAATAAGTTGNTQHKATVTGLKPGASYQYAVSSDGTHWSPAYDFKIPAATGNWKFAVIADPQLHNTTWDANNRYVPTLVGGETSKTGRGWLDTMVKIVSHDVSFIVSGGDQVDASGGNETEYTLFYAPPGLRNLPFAPVSGNHDNHLNFNYHYNLPNSQIDFADETVATEKGRNYYYLYNNILFVVLNTAPYAPTPGASHLNAFDATANVARYKTTIQRAKAANVGKYRWLIVQHHKSTASIADHCADRDIESYVKAGFEKVMSEENVDFVLAGHDHVYARSYPLEGKDNGMVSVPDKNSGADLTVGSKTYTKANYTTSPGKPIYLTFTTGSGLKYYAVAGDPQFLYTDTVYVKDNTTYPYLGEVTDQNGTSSTKFGSSDYRTGNYKPVSNAAYVQPYIPSYCIAEVTNDGKTIKFSTYAIETLSGTSDGASQPYSFDATIPYDLVQVTKN